MDVLALRPEPACDLEPTERGAGGREPGLSLASPAGRACPAAVGELRTVRQTQAGPRVRIPELRENPGEISEAFYLTCSWTQE